MSNYNHIACDATVTIDVTKEEAAAIFRAYDYGIGQTSDKEREALSAVMAKLKDQLWP
jgi:hypothetical protein